MVQTQIEGGDSKISELPATTTVTAADYLILNQGGLTYRIVASDFTLNIGATGPVTITGGTINNTTIGATTPSTGVFTTLTATVWFTTPDAIITGGTLNGVTIGGTTPGAGTFTTLSATSLAGSAYATGMTTFISNPTSANLAATVTDETGTGLLVFNNGPTLVAPVLGTPASGDLSNTTNYPIARDIHAAVAKTTSAAADEFAFWDSVSGNLEKITWSNILSQLQLGFTYADATGTSDAITATYTVPGFTALTDGFDVTLGIATPNTTNTPTFAPTINGAAQTARTIVKFVNNTQVPVAVGDLQGDCWLIYDSINLVWILQTPNLEYLGKIPLALATGTSDAITASYTAGSDAVNFGTDLIVKITTPNATTSPTFNPTINGTAHTAVPIYRYEHNSYHALNPGDLQGLAWLKYDGSFWLLQNPATGSVPQIQYISETLSAGALTVNCLPTILDFRSATITSGATQRISIDSTLTITVPSGATLGTTNGLQFNLILLVAYNGGSPVLCIVNNTGGLNLDETNLISPTTISGTSNSASVIYSASAVSANSPYRIVGYRTATEPTAGSWVTGPALVQGAGGLALSAMQSLGYGQTMQDMSASRVSGTTYYNTTARPITIYATVTYTSANTFTGYINTLAAVAVREDAAGGGAIGTPFIVPPGFSYSISWPFATSFTWYELR